MTVTELAVMEIERWMPVGRKSDRRLTRDLDYTVAEVEALLPGWTRANIRKGLAVVEPGKTCATLGSTAGSLELARGGETRLIDMPTGTASERACSGEIGCCQQLLPVIPIPTWKRAVDIVVSAFGLLILSPALAALALVIKAVSPGPVFFTQQRVGLGGKLFSCLKFRTMHTGSDATAHQALTARLVRGDRVMTKLDHLNDPRIIRGGNWLRKSCLDELPQLFNILL
jgi:hypothetical protein